MAIMMEVALGLPRNPPESLKYHDHSRFAHMRMKAKRCALDDIAARQRTALAYRNTAAWQNLRPAGARRNVGQVCAKGRQTAGGLGREPDRRYRAFRRTFIGDFSLAGGFFSA